MRPQRLPHLLGIALLSACWTAHATEWKSEDAGVSFQLPIDPDWERIPGPRDEARLTLARTDGQAAVVLISFHRKPAEVLDEEFVKRWEKGFFKKGHSIKVSGEFFTFKGKPAYKLIDEENKDGVVVAGAVILWFQDDKLLEIAATKRGSAPLEDPVIKAFVNSMKPVSKSGSGVTNPQGGADGRKSSGPQTNQTSAAAGSHRSP